MKQTPTIIRVPAEMALDSEAARAAGQTLGLVPTMGALHQGHLSLVDYARPRCQRLVVSIFVNPLQFDNPDDLEAYPRTFERDRELCSDRGTDVIYCPTADQMYPPGFQTQVRVKEMTQGLCGAVRPGHFDGVTTVVLKLFNAVKPHFAVFGEKDYQQLKVIERLTRDLNLDLEVVGRPTVREPDGLALSSRNQHLNPQERAEALCLWRALCRAREAAQGGERDAGRLKELALAEISATDGARLRYLEVVDAENLTPLAILDRPARMALSVQLGETFLIDNMALN